MESTQLNNATTAIGRQSTMSEWKSKNEEAKKEKHTHNH